MKNRSRNIYSAIVLFLVMFLFAVTENIRGVLIPQFKTEFTLNATQISYMLTLGSIFYIAMTYFIGRISEMIGQKKSQIMGVSLMIVACLIMAYSRDYAFFLIGVIGMNMALAINGVVANVVLPLMFLSMQSILMNSMHFMYGAGATIGQKFAGYLVSLGFTFRNLYLIMAIILGGLLLLLIMSEFPEPEKHEVKEKKGHLFKNPLFRIYAASVGLYVFAEQGLAVWFMDYLKVTYSMNENKGSTYMAVFFLLLAIGRLIGGFIVEKAGYFKMIIAAVLSGSFAVTLGLILGGKFLFLISFAGLLYSITFPTLMITISKSFDNRIAYITGVILTFSSIVNMLMNQLMGFVTDMAGYSISIFLMPISGFLAAFFYILLYRRYREKIKKEKEMI